MNINHNTQATLIAVALCCLPNSNITAQQKVVKNSIQQKEDKSTADAKVYNLLSTYTGGRLVSKTFDFSHSKLTDTQEDGIKIAEGTKFQINSLRSDIYVDNTTKQPVFSKRYPMESAVNLLMNMVGNDAHRINITHHQYGNVRKKVLIPLNAIYLLLAADKDVYCSVTKIDANHIEANLVMHQPKSDYIHLFVVQMSINELFKPEGIITADLYSNIPQDNVKSIYSKQENRK